MYLALLDFEMKIKSNIAILRYALLNYKLNGLKRLTRKNYPCKSLRIG